MPEYNISSSKRDIDWLNISIGKHQHSLWELSKHHEVVPKTLVNKRQSPGLTNPSIQVLHHDNREQETGLSVF